MFRSCIAKPGDMNCMVFGNAPKYFESCRQFVMLTPKHERKRIYRKKIGLNF